MSKIFINKNTKSELVSFKGIGPTLADRIIEHRSIKVFSSESDILNVRGIGQNSLQNILRSNSAEIAFDLMQFSAKFYPILDRDLQIRNDPAGSGHWGAPRGTEKHKGVDIICQEGDSIYAPINGKFTKYGWPSDDDGKQHLRYIEITGSGEDSDYIVRLMYCTKTNNLNLNAMVRRGDKIGEAQSVSKAYGKTSMIDHIHYEVKNSNDGNHIDPTDLIF